MSASNTAVRVSASSKQVREWAEKEGLIGKGQRGRLGANVIKAYNKSHAVKHTEAKFVQTIKHTAKPAKGRKVTRTVAVPLVRSWAREQGLSVGERGTLPTSVLDAYVLTKF
jgi:hypothetical protein